MKSIIRTIIILAVVTALGIVGYKMFIQKDTAATDNSSLVTTSGVAVDTSAAGALSNQDAETATRDFLTLLLNVRSIKLDNSLFTSNAFSTLQDLSRPINPDTNPGRDNPFAPLGADTSAVSTQVTTGNPSAVSATASTLNGTLSVGGTNVTRWFEYGTTATLGMKSAIKSQTNPGAFAETITGLLPNTTYYVKAVASIGGQTVAGAPTTWKTAPAANR